MLAQIRCRLSPFVWSAVTQILTTACSIKDKEGQIAQHYVNEDDAETLKAFRRYQVQESISRDDVADGA
jgi:hypothetical protein